MKKLALALVCLVSVAFFASCDPKVENPEPAIQVLVEEGFVKSGDVVNEMDTVYFGFVVASNAETAEKLTSLIITIDGAGFDTVNFTEETTEYTYKMGTVFPPKVFEPTRDSIVGTRTITAVVTDADGKTNTASIELSLNYHEEPLLTVNTFEWIRKGGNPAEGLDQFGLEWKKNVQRGFYASITPMEGALLYKIDDLNRFEAITTSAEKAALFTELAAVKPLDKFEEIELNGYHTTVPRDFLLATIYNDNTYLIRVKTTSTDNAKAEKWTIEGEWK
ncbi:MAG: hypothetical protein J6P73_03220 [Bacteroidales bacterium]|nr:hypothetical protein [Bacteroidales bacterium]